MNQPTAWISNRLLHIGTTTPALPMDELGMNSESRTFSHLLGSSAVRWYEHVISPTLPIDDLLALVEPPDWQRVDAIRRTYGAFGLLPGTDLSTPAATKPVLERWRKQRLVRLFQDAAEAGTAGTIKATLAKHFERVSFTPSPIDLSVLPSPPGRTAAVPDLPALAAWMLIELVQSQKHYEVRPCGNCGLPFIASSRATYCKRTAPQSHEQTCQDYSKVRDFYARKKEGDDGEHR